MSFTSTVYGKYILLDRIAVGGMAEVFKAKTFGVRGFERLLVIKRILPHLSKDEEFVEMFIDEAKISVELTHANICQVTDLGKIEDNYFIAMEYIDGKDLRAILKKCYTVNAPLSVPQALYIAIEVLKGMDYAHRKRDPISGQPLNLIHRDISPQNVMVSYHGNVKVVDFGIAKTEFKLNQTQAGVLKGKFGYMSPEQATGIELDSRTDLFSCGIILYEMLSGRRLFLGETDFETLEKIKECDIPPIAKYNQEVGPELEAALGKFLKKEPADRYTSAHEALTALSKILFNQYPDFSVQDLSEKLSLLFAKEIEDEKEALRRALDSVPATDLRAATSAAEAEHQVIVDSNAKRADSHGSSSQERSHGRNLDEWLAKSRNFLQSERFRKLRPLFIFLLPALLVFIIYRAALSPDPVPAEKPAAATQALSTQIISEPPGANVFIDGRLEGQTPMRLHLNLKTYYGIRLEMDGFEPFTERILVSETQTTFGPYKLERTAPATGILHVRSEPPGAEIWMDGKKTPYVTPARILDLPLEERVLFDVVLAGYETESRSFTPTEAEGELEFSLRPKLAELRLSITPSHASVFLDGGSKDVGHEIYNLQAERTYRLKIVADGYIPVERSFTPKQPQSVLHIQLKENRPPMGLVGIQADPWATVYLNGKRLGNTPLIDQEIPVGTQTLEFRHPDYKTQKVTVKINEGAKNKKITVQMR